MGGEYGMTGVAAATATWPVPWEQFGLLGHISFDFMVNHIMLWPFQLWKYFSGHDCNVFTENNYLRSECEPFPDGQASNLGVTGQSSRCTRKDYMARLAPSTFHCFQQISTMAINVWHLWDVIHKSRRHWWNWNTLQQHECKLQEGKGRSSLQNPDAHPPWYPQPKPQEKKTDVVRMHSYTLQNSMPLFTQPPAQGKKSNGRLSALGCIVLHDHQPN